MLQHSEPVRALLSAGSVTPGWRNSQCQFGYATPSTASVSAPASRQAAARPTSANSGRRLWRHRSCSTCVLSGLLAYLPMEADVQCMPWNQVVQFALHFGTVDRQFPHDRRQFGVPSHIVDDRRNSHLECAGHHCGRFTHGGESQGQAEVDGPHDLQERRLLGSSMPGCPVFETEFFCQFG